jgi:hypothetical protein
MKHLGFLLAIGIILAAANSALAISVMDEIVIDLDGLPVDGGSWHQGFTIKVDASAADIKIDRIWAEITTGAETFSSVILEPPFDNLRASKQNVAAPMPATKTHNVSYTILEATDLNGTGWTAQDHDSKIEFDLWFSNTKKTTPDFTMYIVAHVVAPLDGWYNSTMFNWYQNDDPTKDGHFEPGKGTIGDWSPTEPTIPEPLTMAGMFLGIGGLAGYLRRRRQV